MIVYDAAISASPQISHSSGMLGNTACIIRAPA